MNAFLLTLMLGFNQGSIPLGIFSDVQDCVDTAIRIQEVRALQDEHDLWCIPIDLKSGYANQDGGVVEIL